MKAEIISVGTELLLCGASVYFDRIAFTPWTEQREEEGLTARQTISLLLLAGTLLLTLSKLTLLGDLSVGRFAAAAAVMAVAYKGGVSVGATAGVAVGLGMDLSAGGMPFYAMAYALVAGLGLVAWRHAVAYARCGLVGVRLVCHAVA